MSKLWGTKVQASNNNALEICSIFTNKATLPTLALEVANQFRLTASQNDSDEIHYLIWSRAAADMNQIDGIINLIKYIVGFGLADELLEFWSKKAFELLFRNVKLCTTEKYLNDNAQRLHDVTCLVMKRLPPNALRNISKLKISISKSLAKANTSSTPITSPSWH